MFAAQVAYACVAVKLFNATRIVEASGTASGLSHSSMVISLLPPAVRLLMSVVDVLALTARALVSLVFRNSRPMLSLRQRVAVVERARLPRKLDGCESGMVVN
jgi:hypothetical protein